MVQSKTELFDIELQKIAEVFKALAHPARLAILKYLAETKTCITGDISEELPLSRTTVSQHLTELKKVELIHGTIDGVKTNYCLNYSRIVELQDKMLKLISDFDLIYKNNCC